MHTASHGVTDLVGVGFGPANLSLCALLFPHRHVTSLFFERETQFRWHDGLMLPGVRVQVSPLKDLVTLVDPTSRFSFLNFLSVHGRLYQQLIASRLGTSRQEFEQYFRWAAGQMDNATFEAEVTDVCVEGGAFTVLGGGRVLARARNIVLGTGRVPYVPAFAAAALGGHMVHAADLMRCRPKTRGRRVVVVGGGQSSAEVVHWLLGDSSVRPASLVWVSRRMGFPPLDDSAFANEWFFPEYVRYFQSLPVDQRSALIDRQRFASDGISVDLLDRIYSQLYELRALWAGDCTYELLPGHEVIAVEGDGDGELHVYGRDGDTDTVHMQLADLVILATGYQYQVPSCLNSLRDLIAMDRDGYRVTADYSIEFDGPPNCRIFVQNAATNTHGVADANLSIIAWRSAVIANAVAGRVIYPVDGQDSLITWRTPRANCGRGDSGAVDSRARSSRERPHDLPYH
jgi:lysine N6-hydroxylase